MSELILWVAWPLVVLAFLAELLDALARGRRQRVEQEQAEVERQLTEVRLTGQPIRWSNKP